MSIATNIKRRRKALHLSQAQCAVAADISPSTLSDIERSKRPPSVATLQAIADVLGCTLAELVS